LSAYSRTLEHVRKLEERVSVLAEGRVPNGIKPHALPWDTPLFHQQLNQDIQVSIAVDRTKTRAEAREIIYIQCCKMLAEIDLNVEKARAEELKKATAFSAFMEVADAITIECNERVDDFTAHIDYPAGFGKVDREEVREAAEVAYRRLLDKNIQEQAKFESQKKRQEEMQKKREEKISAMTGPQVLEAWADDFVRTRFGLKPKLKAQTSSSISEMLDVKTVDVTPNFKPPPGLAPLQKGKGNGSPPGKGKGKSKGKGKGRGGGKQNAAFQNHWQKNGASPGWRQGEISNSKGKKMQAGKNGRKAGVKGSGKGTKFGGPAKGKNSKGKGKGKQWYRWSKGSW